MIGKTLLLVEDSEAKLASIRGVVDSLGLGYRITCAKSVKSAIEEIRKNNFDVILVDMSLPTFDVENRERGGTPRPFGGIEIFDFLERRAKYVPVIVVSAYEALVDGPTSTSLPELGKKLSREFPSLYAGYVFFDSAYLEWEEKLRILLKGFENEKE